jgi:hypothetical protein
MDDIAIARALHVLAVVMWIGGVAVAREARPWAGRPCPKSSRQRLDFVRAGKFPLVSRGEDRVLSLTSVCS